MINYKEIFDELQAMQSNGRKFFKGLTPEEFRKLNDFLEDNKYELGIGIIVHEESMTGNRSIDSIMVKKL